MKFFHISDLHIGRQLHGFSLIPDQRYILAQIIGLVRERKPRLLLIAGDVYDKAVPSAEAVAVFDDFLTELAGLPESPQVLMISGNHDSRERLSFGSRLFDGKGIHIVGNPPDREHPEIRRMSFSDEYGKVCVYLLPFFRPSYLREIPGLEEAATYEEAMRRLIEREHVDPSLRNVLLCHQFFTRNGSGPERADSETISVGGQDNIDVSAVSCFDYVAAGHIHGPQAFKNSPVYYCGSPLKYSVSEAGREKSVAEVTLGRKGQVSVQRLPLSPLHDVRRIAGTLADLTAPEALLGADPEDYVSAVLWDEELYEPGAALSAVYPNLLEWRVENSRTQGELSDVSLEYEEKSPLELFADFYCRMQGKELDEKQRKAMERVMELAGGEKE